MGIGLLGLGSRICVLGPSGSGKSTLTAAIGRKRDLPVVHLDQLRHVPHSDWRARPERDFVHLHDRAIACDAWVIEGNYTICMEQRLARATGVILLDVSAGLSLWRYVRRCRSPAQRIGGLDGNADSVKWEMIRHILRISQSNRRRYDRLYQGLSLPKCRLGSRRKIEAFYRHEGLHP